MYELISIKPKDDSTQTVKCVKETLKDSILSGEISVINVTEHDNVVKIRCENSDMKEKVKLLLNEKISDKCDVVEGIPPASLLTASTNKIIKVFNIPEDEFVVSNDDCLQNIIKQNNINTSKPNFVMKTVYVNPRLNQKGSTYMLIELDIDTYNEVKKNERIKTLWNSCYYEEHVNVKVCKNCQSYGHTQNYCKSLMVCSFCGVNGHKYSECNSQTKNCINCIKYNNKCGTKMYEHNHCSYEYRSCQSYQRIRDKILDKESLM